MTLRIAAALSRTAEAGLAAAEAADAVGARLAELALAPAADPPATVPAADADAGTDAPPLPPVDCDLAVAFVSAEHLDGLEDVAAAIETRLEPGVLLAAVAQGVIGPGEEVEAGPAVAVWAAELDGGWVQPFRSWAMRPSSGGLAVAGWPDTMPGDLTLVLADPYSFPAGEVVARLGEDRPGQVVLGGLLTAGEGRSRFVLDDRVHDDGAVGVVLRDVAVDAVVSQGCRPVGEPLTVTQAVRDRVLGLGGEPATQRLEELVESVDEQDRELLRRGGVHLGVVVDEVQDAYAAGDFLVRSVLGFEPEAGALTIGDALEVGKTVQFQVRDAASAAADLRRRLSHLDAAAGALLFSCTGRGARLFGHTDHDVAAVQAVVDGGVAGAFCAGEIGPVGERSYLHGFTASLAVFGDDTQDGPELPGRA